MPVPRHNPALSDHAVLVEEVLVGTVKPFGPARVPSAIEKVPVDGPARLDRNGFVDDRQGDRARHGGPEKAIHHYPRDHYAAWRIELGMNGILDAPGAFGENLSTSWLTECDVCIGDVWQVGTALLQLSQGRQPCFKLNLRFGVTDMALRVQRSLRTGWYYRVLEGGVIARGDQFVLRQRPHPDWPLARALDLLFRRTLAFDELECMSLLAELRCRVECREIEDWNERLRIADKNTRDLGHGNS